VHCPFCGSKETKVIDSRVADDGSQVRRRRECLQCVVRFTTREAAELDMPRVIKRDGRQCAFDVNKIRNGMLKALEKRPVSIGDIDRAVNRLIHQIQISGERGMSTEVLGQMVMRELSSLDQVAYVRFASIYKSFQDVSEFHREIQQLKELQND
jgi:transcriptional regulator NrdR